jgi:hypothetical protein
LSKKSTYVLSKLDDSEKYTSSHDNNNNDDEHNDDEQIMSDDSEKDILFPSVVGRHQTQTEESYLLHDDDEDSLGDKDGDELTTVDGGKTRFKWRAGQHINSPTYKSNQGKSFVKAESVGLFRLPFLSFLAFVPLKLFKSMVYYSNMYADSLMDQFGNQLISGARWPGDITISEIMAFFGILIKMVV